jgi:hypothetical protein
MNKIIGKKGENVEWAKELHIKYPLLFNKYQAVANYIEVPPEEKVNNNWIEMYQTLAQNSVFELSGDKVVINRVLKNGITNTHSDIIRYNNPTFESDKTIISRRVQSNTYVNLMDIPVYIVIVKKESDNFKIKNAGDKNTVVIILYKNNKYTFELNKNEHDTTSRIYSPSNFDVNTESTIVDVGIFNTNQLRNLEDYLVNPNKYDRYETNSFGRSSIILKQSYNQCSNTATNTVNCALFVSNIFNHIDCGVISSPTACKATPMYTNDLNNELLKLYNESILSERDINRQTEIITEFINLCRLNELLRPKNTDERETRDAGAEALKSAANYVGNRVMDRNNTKQKTAEQTGPATIVKIGPVDGEPPQTSQSWTGYLSSFNPWSKGGKRRTRHRPCHKKRKSHKKIKLHRKHRHTRRRKHRRSRRHN